MAQFREKRASEKDKKIAVYGLGTETERFLRTSTDDWNVVGLLDGFREEGEIYGYPILSLKTVIGIGVKNIIVIARPGSCKAIAKRIGDICRENDIALFDVRGNDLLSQNKVSYIFDNQLGCSKTNLFRKLDNADVVSFDLFDTLITRKVLSYTDIFELVDLKLREKGICIPDFAKQRLSVEKELARFTSPRLEDIYFQLLKNTNIESLDTELLSDLEWQIDSLTMIPRNDVCDIYKRVISSGKEVIITTDQYYTVDKIKQILDKFGLDGYDAIFDSCEYKTYKIGSLFDIVKEHYTEKRILHIGDDEQADIRMACGKGIDTFHILKGEDLFDALGGMGISDNSHSLSDRLKTGLFISRVFNSPFWFEHSNKPVSVKDAFDVGYLFCAPIITDFIIWLKSVISTMEDSQILFGARDGYLIKKLYDLYTGDDRSLYFLTSRIAAIRAGLTEDADVEYVNSMKYSGNISENIKARFGIDISDEDENIEGILIRSAREKRENYLKYIKKLGITGKTNVFFDFVAKGTTQMFLEKIISRKVKGLYFLQLEPEFMDRYELDIEPFYSEDERENSAIFDNYYILETVLTAPHPQVLEFDKDGEPIYASETRAEAEIMCSERMQQGVEQFFRDYISILPRDCHSINKALDEEMLSLVNKILILDEDFNNLHIEDPFFGRNTVMSDVTG